MTGLYVNEFCIGLHSKCNWNCPYCISKNNNIPMIESEILEEVVKRKHVLGQVFLSGGEPGLLSESFWDSLFNISEHKLSICSNGTFIKQKYHIKHNNKIRSIILHCVSELDQEIDQEILDWYTQKHKYNKELNIVVHNKNSHLLYDFLKKYEHINFLLYFTDETFHMIHSDEPYDYSIKKESAINIIKELGKIKNYSNYSNILTKAVIKNDYKNLNSWSYMNRELG